jgi:hypothetical protein
MALTNSNISKTGGSFNDFTWRHLTQGKLMAMARICKQAADNGDALANDCYHEILNCFYDADKPVYDMIVKL